MQFQRCMDENYVLYFNGKEEICVPECKIGEYLDEDYYCVEMVYLSVAPVYLADAADQSLKAIKIMSIIVLAILLSFCCNSEQRLDKHDKFWTDFEKLNQE